MSTPRRSCLFGALVCAAALGGPISGPAPAAADEMYRWVDAQGRVHFTSTPPPGAQRFEPGRKLNRMSSPPASMSGGASSGGADRHSGAEQIDRSRRGPDTAPAHRIGGRSRYEWGKKARYHARRIENLERNIERAEERIENTANWRSSRSASRYEVKQQRLIRQYERQLESAEAEQDRFEAEARSAEVPPGWLR